MSDHVPVTVSFETDKRRLFGLQDGEVGVKFTRVSDPSHISHDVIRMTREEIRAARDEFSAFLGE